MQFVPYNVVTVKSCSPFDVFNQNFCNFREKHLALASLMVKYRFFFMTKRMVTANPINSL